MIKQFKSKDTALIWSGDGTRRLSVMIQNLARRKLRMLNAAKQLQDLKIPPGNRLEALKGDRAGEYSIRVNDQWRICFKWQNGDAYAVTLEDYH